MTDINANQVRTWFDEGIGKKYMFIVFDKDKSEYHPMYARNREEAMAMKGVLQASSDSKIIEIYDLSLSIDSQIGQTTVWAL